MSTAEMKMAWEPKAHTMYQGMIQKIPLFHREIAQIVVEKKAQQNAQARGAAVIEQDDIVAAFFSEVPKAFYSLMVRLLDEAGFDYGKYIQPKSAEKK